MNRFDTTPYRRSTVGFDRLFDLMERQARNAGGDLAIVGVTAWGCRDSGMPSGFRFRLALASVAPVPLRPETAERILAEQPVSEATIEAAARAAMADARPIDDARGSARYRRLMVRNLTRQAVTDVWQTIRDQ